MRRQAKDLGGSDGPSIAAGVFGEGDNVGGAARYRAGKTKPSGYAAITAEQQDWLEQHELPHGIWMSSAGLADALLASAICAGRNGS